MVNANIFQQYLKPVRSVDEYRAELDTAEARQNALAAAAMDRKGREQAMRDEQAYRGAVSASGGDQNALIKALNAQGLGTRAQAVQKSILESDQVRAEIGVKNSTTAKNTQGTEQASRQAHIQAAGMIQSPDDAMQWGVESVRLGIMTPEQLQQGLSRIPSDPQGLQQWKAQVMQGGMTVLQQLESTAPKPQEVKLGNVVKFLDMNQRSQTFGKEVAPTQQMGQSPDNAASTGVAIRGQNITAQGQQLTDQRARERLDFDKSKPVGGASDKPMPTTALKMVQESLDAIGISSSIFADLGAVEDQIKNGKVKFGPISNLANSALNKSGFSNEESRNFASFKSTLERLRNESLRLNAGVQTDGDAQRAWNELFQDITDTKLVQQRLAEIKNINKRGVDLHQLRADSIRSNYGQDPIDASAYRAQPPALNSGNAKPANRQPLADIFK